MDSYKYISNLRIYSGKTEIKENDLHKLSARTLEACVKSKVITKTKQEDGTKHESGKTAKPDTKKGKA